MKIGICSKCNREKILYNVKSKQCKSCYNSIHHDKKKSYASQKKWKDKNKNYWKDYWLIHRQLKQIKMEETLWKK